MSQLIIERTSQFKRDVKKAIKRGKDATKLKKLMVMLAERQALPIRYRDHALTGNYKGTRECHIEPDWLLVYTLDEQLIRFERTGSHSDLFK